MGKAKEKYARAVDAVRIGILEGRYLAGQRVSALDLAEGLRLSSTPIRQALSEAAGAGLLEARPGDGYYVPQADADRLADLYRTQGDVVRWALSRATLRANQPLAVAALAALEPKTNVLAAFAERLMRRMVAMADSRSLTFLHARMCDRLAFARPAELLTFPDLGPELALLCALYDKGDATSLAQAVGTFHQRRADAAARLRDAFRDTSIAL